jgi:hypothetical protein
MISTPRRWGIDTTLIRTVVTWRPARQGNLCVTEAVLHPVPPNVLNATRALQPPVPIRSPLISEDDLLHALQIKPLLTQRLRLVLRGDHAEAVKHRRTLSRSRQADHRDEINRIFGR